MENNDNANPMTSYYPSNYHADALNRVVRVKADLDLEFPVSADARNRMAVRLGQRDTKPYWSVPEQLTSVATGRGPWKH